MTSSTSRRKFSRYASAVAVATLGLICLGGLVTSHEAGLAVPDWPNSYGYNMFFFPVSQWVGGILYEHSHRLWASFVGLLTTILALWLHGKNARPLLRWGGAALIVVGLATFATSIPNKFQHGISTLVPGAAALLAGFFWLGGEPADKWLRRLGLLAFVTVAVQGLLGGLRVTQLSNALGIFHGTLAQLFFILIAAIALFTSDWWREPGGCGLAAERLRRLRLFFVVATGLIFLQLVLGATMRHQHAGLAIKDFPLAYGKLWPAMDAESLKNYNQQRNDVTAPDGATAFQISLQMAHRIGAVLVCAAVIACAWFACRRTERSPVLARLALLWLGLIVGQVALGAATIWTNKSADVATAHVAVGALSLLTGAMTVLVCARYLAVATPATSRLATNETSFASGSKQAKV